MDKSFHLNRTVIGVFLLLCIQRAHVWFFQRESCWPPSLGHILRMASFRIDTAMMYAVAKTTDYDVWLESLNPEPRLDLLYLSPSHYLFV